MEPDEVSELKEEQPEIYVPLFDEDHIYRMDEIGLGAFVKVINFDKLDRNQ